MQEGDFCGPRGVKGSLRSCLSLPLVTPLNLFREGEFGDGNLAEKLLHKTEKMPVDTIQGMHTYTGILLGVRPSPL